jgi:hypothetical protein
MTPTSARKWPFYGWIGLALAIIFWILNWSLPGLRTHWGFFPMWTGYCLIVDAMVFTRKGHSLLTRNPRAYIALFFISIPGWWLFELINWRMQNWFYIGEESFSDSEYFLLSSLSFSTVMPAVFGTAELTGTFKWMMRIKRGPLIPLTSDTSIIYFTTGIIMLILLLFWPVYFFPLVWLSVYFILEPLNSWLKNRTLLSYLGEGNWQPILSLWCGCLICGFFWEMWNFYSYPKWVYHIPFFDFLRIFEMPLLGYLGYIPFSLELFAMYHFITGIFKSLHIQDYIQLTVPERQTVLT